MNSPKRISQTLAAITLIWAPLFFSAPASAQYLETTSPEEFVSEYYGYAGWDLWGVTYTLLDDEAKSEFTESDWSLAQGARAGQNPTPPVASAEITASETLGESIVADVLITYEDGTQEEISGFTMSINPADGTIQRSLTDEDVAYLWELVDLYENCGEDGRPDCDDLPPTPIAIPGMVDVAEDAMRDATTSTGAINQGETTTEETTSVSAPDTADIAEDALRDSTTAVGAINPEETTAVSVPGNVDVAEDAARDAAAAAGAVNESAAAIEDLMVEETAEASGIEGTSAGGMPVEDASVVRFESMRMAGGGAAIMVGVLLAGWCFWLLRR